MKFLKWLGIILLLLIIVYFLGPQPSSPKFETNLPIVPAEPAALEKYIHDRDAMHKLKPDNLVHILSVCFSQKQNQVFDSIIL